MFPSRFIRFLVLVGVWLSGFGLSALPAQDNPPVRRPNLPGVPRPVPRATPPASPAEIDPNASDLDKLNGTWLFESAFMGDRNLLTECWNSQLTIKGGGFKLSQFMGVQKDLIGAMSLEPGESPKKIDLNVRELDLAEFNIPLKVPAGKLEGIYQLDGDRLQLCIAMSADQLRPASFQSIRLKSVSLQFSRIDPSQKSNGKEWKALAVDTKGKPVAGAKIFPFMTKRDNDPANSGDWVYSNVLTTGGNGMVAIPVDLLKSGMVCGRHLEKHTIGFGQVSPAAAHKGVITIELQPETRVLGTIVSEELRKLSKPLGLTFAYLEKNGVRLALNVSNEGKFEFLVPPGNYSIFATGPDLQGKSVKLLVIPETTEITPDPTDLLPQRTVFLQGDQAPELTGIIGWKGEPVKIADCRGKYVLLAFWGYWSAPSVDALPVLMDIQTRYKSKNVMVIGVHIDANGEILNPIRFDQKIEPLKAGKWGDRSINFPVALASGKQFDEYKYDPVRGGPGALYGIGSFPTTVLINPEGKIVGCFPGTDAIAADARIQELLKKTEEK